MRVHWVAVFLDVPAEATDRALDFWSAVSGAGPAEPAGKHGQFLPLEQAAGQACLWVQRTADGPVRCHPDLYVDDLAAAVTRASDLGAVVTARYGGVLVVLSSPGGLPFCLLSWDGQHVRPEPVGPAGARSVIDQLCLDIPPSRFQAEGQFWSALTGWPLIDRDPADEFARLTRPADIPYAFLLQRLDDEQSGVSAHLDLACEDRDAESARHRALGARQLRRDRGWTVLQDPTGQLYCCTGRRPGAV